MSANANFTLPQFTLHGLSDDLLEMLIKTAVTKVESKIQPQYDDKISAIERKLLSSLDGEQQDAYHAIETLAIQEANHVALASFHVGLLLGLGILPLSHVRGEKAEFAS